MLILGMICQMIDLESVYGMPPQLLRGEIWRVNLNPGKGSEIQKIRPAVIISSDLTIGHPVRLVVPITGWDTKYGRVRWIVPIKNTTTNGLEKPSAADTTATRSLAISVERFKQKLGNLEPEALNRVVSALADVIEF